MVSQNPWPLSLSVRSLLWDSPLLCFFVALWHGELLTRLWRGCGIAVQAFHRIVVDRDDVDQLFLLLFESDILTEKETRSVKGGNCMCKRDVQMLLIVTCHLWTCLLHWIGQRLSWVATSGLQLHFPHCIAFS